ncbi:transcriptional regulator GcvA [Rhodospirillaceae bacterium SYSU D60014]|uniref:transcriptional regulator GcvA n=1 Tax=Virgifigura deserti TaxID=2268457 RepID=UPI000E666899
MSRRLPPLNALRAFEAAARHLSFAKAAAELHVTPAAISHQIKALEAHLGLPLFRRLNRAVLLTDAGQRCLSGVREGFDRLAEAMERVRAEGASGPLTVTVSPSFAGKWLVPRLDRFRQAHPDIDVRIDASSECADFTRDDVDIGIRFGTGRYPGLRVDHLMDDRVVPACSPRLVDGPHPLRTPDDLRWHTLLHVDHATRDETWPDWRMWLLAAGVRDVDSNRGPKFSQASMAIQTAIEGHGVVLAEQILLADDLAAGRLVKPFDLSLSPGFAHYVVCLETAADRPKIAAFRDWLFAEVER